MNRFLVEAAGTLNWVLGLLIIIGCTWTGTWSAYNYYYDPSAGFLSGLVVGCTLAFVVCSLLALIVSIHETLDHTRQLLEKEVQDRLMAETEPDTLTPHTEEQT